MLAEELTRSAELDISTTAEPRTPAQAAGTELIQLPCPGAAVDHAQMRYSINIPNFGDFADARNVASVAEAAEDAGWDALFIWDHVVLDEGGQRAFGDPWMLLTAAALATTRIRLGALVTPVARRRPQQLARQVSTLDHISGGRVVFAAGLGDSVEGEYGSFGEPTDQRLLAERLDEGLGLLERYWSGQPVTHHGQHFQARDVALLPAPVQRPRPPVWVAGRWPNRRPMRRAARWDGVVPLFRSAPHGHAPPAEDVSNLVDYIRNQRDGQRDVPFEVVVGGVSPAVPGQARDLLAPLIDAGATWWDERRPLGDQVDQFEPVLRRVEQGPPTVP